MSERPRDWNAASYQRVSAPLEAMGREVLDRLELRGDERVLDAGCGTGRVTAALVERLRAARSSRSTARPRWSRRRASGSGPGVEVFVADLLELSSTSPVDAILSTATFHWIADHDRLFERLYAALRRGGGSSPSAAGRATSPTVQAAIDAVAEPALRGLARAVELPVARGRPRRGSSGSASPTSAPGRRTCASSPTTCASTSAPSMLGSHLERIRGAAAPRSLRPCSRAARAGDRLRPPNLPRPA
jgi:SAM-dependent methyltransferase